MKLQHLSHRELDSYLTGYDVLTLYPLYICRKAPQGHSPVVLDDSGIVGTVVYGRDFGIYPTRSFWLWANTPEGAEILLNELKAQHGADIELNFPLHCYDVVQQIFPDREITIDRFYALIPSKFQRQQTNHTIVPVTPTLLNQVVVPDELSPMIGDPEKFKEDSPLYGIIQEDQLITLGEAIVDVGTCAGIGQVYTLQTYRGQGLGKVMVSAIAEFLLKQGKTPIYWVSENNPASIRLAESLGFELLLRWGCME